MTITLWNNTTALAWAQKDLSEYPEEVPVLKTFLHERNFMRGWMLHLKTGLEQFINMPVMVRKCLDSAHRYLYAQTHIMDRREAHQLACPLLPKLLTVMDRYTTDTECDHKICRAIVCILGSMSARMNGGYNQNEFRACPFSSRPDERGLFYRLDFTVENKAQFQVCEATRTQASAVINKYLDQMKVDGFDEEETGDVENVIEWIEAGMFMCLVPLTRDPCPCFKCRGRQSS